MADRARTKIDVINLKNGINEIKNSGKYYVSNEIKNELDAIDDGLNHLHLEGTIENSSNDMRAKVATEGRPGVDVTLKRAAGTLQEYRDLMNMTNYESKQENELRELHHWALLSLKDIQNDITPHTYGSWKRLYDFKNDVGVTDMYTGFRSNVSRPREPCEPNSHWTGKPSIRFIETKSGQLRRPKTEYDACRSLSAPAGKLAKQGPPVEWTGDLSRTKLGHALPPKVSTRGYKTIDSLYPRATVESRLEPPEHFHHQSIANLKPADIVPVDKPKYSWSFNKTSPQEAAGICTDFPGTSEYMSRYGSPNLNRYGGGYTINPKPDFEMHGRKLLNTMAHPKCTEYQSRYDWPSGDKICKFPWLRR